MTEPLFRSRTVVAHGETSIIVVGPLMLAAVLRKPGQ